MCAVLGLDTDRVRNQAWQICTKGFRIPIRRRRLGAETHAKILAGLARGETTTQLGQRFNINPATVRKVRIRARREAGEVAA